MKKSLKKVISVFLALVVLFAVPVIAGATEGEHFDFSSASVKAVGGSWKDDYVEKIQITLVGDSKKLVGTGAVISIGTNEDADNVGTFDKNQIEVSFSGKNTVITVSLYQKLDHAAEYKFDIKEDAFATDAGKTNASYIYSTTGNLILETLNLTPFDIPLNPIEKLIYDMEHSEYSWLFYPIIIILKFFVSL